MQPLTMAIRDIDNLRNAKWRPTCRIRMRLLDATTAIGQDRLLPETASCRLSTATTLFVGCHYFAKCEMVTHPPNRPRFANAAAA